ncbi:unnamed protein product [Clonostachys byssicola]|uniref:Protein kinase domain-containing protein n=1 Tax=Clonostachys byssicola TaxID=160290 RepID=A0A9N9U082_9HYPO|nr:unnamed protein product [Clonostachys byssicola]
MAESVDAAGAKQDASVVSEAFQSLQVTVDNHDDLGAGSRPVFPHNEYDSHAEPKDASPMRHHKRTPSAHREVKETLDAHVEILSDESDGRTHHRINQYVIQDEIGRGSYGSVHVGTDQFGTEYAIKEFSKVRLRKRAQSNILRQGPHRPFRRVPNSNLEAHGSSMRTAEQNDALYLIREEVAIMKKLNHPNLVQLIEVLDDPEEDSLYMVMEMCKKGVVMQVGLDETAKPYSEETCRHLFRDLVLGIEYLHAQGVIHRDIKPDNLLLSEDDVLKVVDFGVSQMFEKPGPMRTAKSAGSPAFLPPELCGKHGDVSGTAADIWSMGVSLYCLKYGSIPFHTESMMEMYDAIKSKEPKIPADENPVLVDLFKRVLEKDPEKRITMPELREHPWVTRDGTDLLLPAEENCQHVVGPPNELELNHAFTRKMNHLLCVMKVLHKFKTIKARKLAEAKAREAESEGGQDSAESHRRAVETAEIEALIAQRRKFLKRETDDSRPPDRDVSNQEPLFLGIGTGSRDDFNMDEPSPYVVADSPTAVDYNVYDRAYQAAVEERLKSSATNKPTLYLTRFVKEKDQLKELGDLIDGSNATTPR